MSGRPGQLHAARIAGKKIRYALELAHDSQVLDAQHEVRTLRRLQTVLGDMNDLRVLRQQMTAFADRGAHEALVGMEKVLSRIKRRQKRSIRRFISDWPKVRRDLRKAKAQPV
jgi:CHAD domain-containing protein